MLVVYRDGVSGSRDVVHVPVAKLQSMRQVQALTGMIAASQAPKYTTSASLNALLARLGVDRSTRLFRGIDRSRLQAMSARARASGSRWVLDIGNAYELHLTGASVERAVAALRRSGQVAYASPAFYVTTMHTRALPIGRKAAANSEVRLTPAMDDANAESHLPSNYGLQSSLQAQFNAPGLNAAAAYDIITRRFGELPGKGVIITNVSLGDLTDASAASDPNDPCHYYANNYGPTTIVQGGQRYLDFPSMPLIPTWTADAISKLDGQGEVCGVDPQLVEVGLDFSMMAPLPHDRQRPGRMGEGLTDLLGIAPGATYRLLVPANNAPTIADLDAALLAASQQSPPPDVITASVGFGEAQYGFSSRYLGDDPLSASIIEKIVNSQQIAVTIASGDGLQVLTNAAVSPSGGSSPTEVADGDYTSLSDIYLTTVPSRVPDTGAIDVGGTTLDDIFAAPPQNSANSALKAQHAFAATRWTGSTTFSSGFGSRVNVSAPSDNVVALVHSSGGAAGAVDVVSTNGTSASAPQVAASVAVLLQVARLTHRLFPGPIAIRDFLEQTGTPVPKVPQSDVNNHVGPQVNLGHAVETLLAQAGDAVAPRVTSVAIEQRRGVSYADAVFQTNTDPGAINLSGANARAWITIAPNWEGIPSDSSYTLRVRPLSGSQAGQATRSAPVAGTVGGILAHTAWARVLPREIFAAANVPLESAQSRSFLFTYTATPPGASFQSVTAHFELTFGPSQEESPRILAPTVLPVVKGDTMTVHYDLRHTGVGNATLQVSQPGRLSPFTGRFYHVAYSTPIGGGEGTVQVPVNGLDGGGLYSVGILTEGGDYGDFAFTRVQPQASSARPPAPLLSANGSEPGHIVDMPYGSDLSVSWDVTDVPGASGAILEFSAGAPNAFGSYSVFNNPNGSERDDPEGVDVGSLYSKRLSGASGSITLSGTNLVHFLYPTLYHNVRVLPVSGGRIVGEASEVSTLTMDGVAASDGGVTDSGWAINGQGLDGLVASRQKTASGVTLTSLQIFDQATNAITQVVASETGHLFRVLGIYGDDLGLYGDADLAIGDSSYSTYHVLNPVAEGSVGSAWTPARVFLLESAMNQETGTGVFLGVAAQPGPVPKRQRVFTSDIAANTFSPFYDVSGPLDSLGYGDYRGIAENTDTNTVVLAATDILNSCGAPTLVKLDLDNGTSRPFSRAWDRVLHKGSPLIRKRMQWPCLQPAIVVLASTIWIPERQAVSVCLEILLARDNIRRPIPRIITFWSNKLFLHIPRAMETISTITASARCMCSMKRAFC